MPTLLLITDLELGGTPTVVRELAIRLHRAGKREVQVACLSRWGPVADQLRDAGVKVTAMNARGPGDWRILPRLIRLIHQERFSTVFSFLLHANAMAAAVSIFVRGDVRWIQSIQTTQPTPRWHWFVQRFAQRAAELIVVPSLSVSRVASEWSGISPGKISVIPNAIDPADWTVHSLVPTSDPRPYPITFLGRLDPIKDVPTLVRAIAQLSPLVHLHIFGEGPDRWRIEQAIAQSKAPVTMHGSIAKPQAALSQSGLLVLPSLAEGFGLVLIEAMAAGVPVVATDVPGICDVVRGGQTGLLVPPSDVNQLAAAIRNLVEDPAMRLRLIQQAQSDVNSRFTWDIMLDRYQRLGL